MKLIFDFDNTLFYEDPFAVQIRTGFAVCGVPEDIYQATRKEAFEGEVWRQFRHMERMAAQSCIPIEHLEHALDRIIRRAHIFLYPDVAPFLQQTYNTHPMSLLTFGDSKFQCMKIEGAGISGFFQDIIVTENIRKDTDAHMLSKGEPALFVEDNPHALEAVKAHAPHIITVRMRRGHGKYADKPSGNGVDYEITSLNELHTFLI